MTCPPSVASAALYSRGCRCESCTEQHRIKQNEDNDRREARGLPDDDPRHGKYTTYTNYRCRCLRCTTAETERQRLRKERTNTCPPPTQPSSSSSSSQPSSP